MWNCCGDFLGIGCLHVIVRKPRKHPLGILSWYCIRHSANCRDKGSFSPGLKTAAYNRQ